MTISQALDILAKMLVDEADNDCHDALAVAINVLDDVLHADVDKYL